MKTILVDDDLLSMEQFEYECRTSNEIEFVGKFNNPAMALRFAERNRVDFAVLDVVMPQMNGLELGSRLRQMYKDMILIYVTGHTQYVVDTLRMKADYCIMKPYNREDVEDVLERVKLLSRRQQKPVQVRMFGRFQVFINNEPVHFRNSKAKELFALCMDHRGGNVTMEEAIDKLWPERPYDERVKRLYRKAVGALQETLLENGISDIFKSSRGGCYAVSDRIESDLMDYMDGKETNEFVLQEGYLYDYSWAEGNFRYRN